MNATIDDPLLDPTHFDAFKDPQFVTAARQMYRANGDRDGRYMLDYAVKKANEGAIEAAQRFVAGDVDGAIGQWSKIPAYGRYDPKRATLLADGRWLLYRVDGGDPATLDPKELRGWLVSLQRTLLASSVATSEGKTMHTFEGAER